MGAPGQLSSPESPNYDPLAKATQLAANELAAHRVPLQPRGNALTTRTVDQMEHP